MKARRNDEEWWPVFVLHYSDGLAQSQSRNDGLLFYMSYLGFFLSEMNFHKCTINHKPLSLLFILLLIFFMASYVPFSFTIRASCLASSSGACCPSLASDS